jgi:hypothetical protein
MGTFDEWKQLAFILSPEDLKNRCETYWNIVMTISGLTAGFSYLVTTGSSVTFNAQEIFQGVDRLDIFGFLNILAFLFSICATILSGSLLGYMNLNGIRHASGFVKRYWYLVDIPIALIMIGLFFMFGSGMIFIGGVYSNWVWYASLGIGTILLSISGITFVIIRISVHRTIDQDYKKLRKTSEIEASSIDN